MCVSFRSPNYVGGGGGGIGPDLCAWLYSKLVFELVSSKTKIACRDPLSQPREARGLDDLGAGRGWNALRDTLGDSFKTS